MRSLLIHLAIAISVIMAGVHTPASAHDVAGIEFAAHCDDSAGVSDADDAKQSSEPVDVGNHAVHHHHCPIGLASNSGGQPALSIVAGLVPPPANSAALASHATAPPLDPPLA